MKRRRSLSTAPHATRDRWSQALLMLGLAGFGVLAVVGPWGVVRLNGYERELAQKRQELADVSARQAWLDNRVRLLSGPHPDPDMVTELLRSQLELAHPDDIVVRRQSDG